MGAQKRVVPSVLEGDRRSGRKVSGSGSGDFGHGRGEIHPAFEKDEIVKERGKDEKREEGKEGVRRLEEVAEKLVDNNVLEPQMQGGRVGLAEEKSVDAPG